MATYTGNGNDNTINGSLNDDTIFGKGGKDWLYGHDGNDTIDGGIGDDFLFGGKGDDVLIGGKGADTMVGGIGADQFKGGQGSDTVDYSGSTSGVNAFLALNLSGGGDAEGDTYTAMENVIGSAYEDILQAGAGGSAMGGAGNDLIYGGGTLFSNEDGGRIRGDAGIDELSMYYGATEAQLQNGLGYDKVYGFDEGSDSFFIDLSDFGLGNSLDASEIRNSLTGTASGGNAQLIWEDDASRLWFDSNGSAAGGKILVADLEGATIDGGNLDTGDFHWTV